MTYYNRIFFVSDRLLFDRSLTLNLRIVLSLPAAFHLLHEAA